MAVTRIKNNQITDSTIQANAKIQNYTVTSALLANNMTYNSDFTVAGNLTVSGNTTTIDTTITTIEDPVILLASTQTGSPTVDIGFIGERGTSDNIAFVWDESADEFVTAFTSTGETNTTITISSYSNFHTNDANIGGNLAVGGNVTITGNVTSLNVTGNITGGNLLTPGILSASGNLTGGNVITAGAVNSATVSASGNITGGNVIVPSGNINVTNFINTGALLATGRVEAGTTMSAAGNITGGNVLTGGQVSATANVTGGNLITSGAVNSATVSASGNITGGNVTTAGITSTGSLTASTTINATGNITGGNVLTGGQVSATGNVTGGNLVATTALVAPSLNVTGNITGGNLLTAGLVSATGTITSAANVIGGNVTTSGQVSATGNISSGANLVATANVIGGNVTTAGQVSATGNVTGGNLVATTALVAPSLNISGNITGGNLLTAGLVSATGNITGGNVTTSGITSTGSLTASTTVSASGNVTGGNVLTGGLVSATGNVNGGNLISAALVQGVTVSASGNVIGGNVTTAGLISATGNVNGGNLISAALVQGTTVSATGNVIGGNLTTSGITSTGSLTATTTISAAGNITGGNVTTSGITSTGSLTASTTVSATGNITGGNISTTGSTVTGTLETTGNALIGGNLIVQGNITYINIDDLRVEDPIIILGTGPNGAPLTTDDGMDRGVYMEWYKTGLGNSWIGWDNSSGNLVAAASVNFSGNNVVNVLQYGTFQAGNLYVQSAVSTGNVTGGNLLTAGQVSATANITGGNVLTSGLISATGNVTGGNLVATTALVAPALNVTGNITGGNLLTAGLISATGNITGGNVTTSGITSTGSLTASTTVSATGNITGGNVLTGGLVSATGNVNGGNLNATTGVRAATGYFTGNVDVLGNLNATVGVVYANSGIFYGNAVTGNNAAFAGIPGFTQLGSNVVMQFAGNVNSYSQLNFQNINNGTSASTDYIATADNGTDTSYYVDLGINSSTFNDPTNYPGFGPNDAYVHNHGGNLILNPETSGKAINFMVGGTANANVIGYVNASGLSVTGIVSASGNVTGGNVLTGGLVSATGNVNGGNLISAALVQGVTVSASGNVIGGNVTTAGLISATGNVNGGNLISAALVQGVTVSASGNVIGGNVTTAGLISATGNIDGGNLRTAGLVSATGNVNGGNVISSALVQGVTVSASGNVIGGNVTTAGQVVATSNITGGNLLTSGLISATGNVNGGNLIGAALVQGVTLSASGNVIGGNVNTAGLISATGNIYGGNLILAGAALDTTAGRLTVNSTSADADFAINGDTTANVFYVDAGTGTASFGSATQTTNAIVAFNSTRSVLMPVGTTGERPGTGVTGMLRFNTTNDALEVYDNSQWTTVGVPSFTVITDDQFNGDGVTVAFTISSSATTAATIVSINGVVQIPTVAYSVSGTTLTFTEAPLSGDLIDVRILTTTTTVTSLSNSSGNAEVILTDTANTVVITGDLIPTANATANLGGPSNYWKSLYVGGNTIYLGNLQLKAENGQMAFYLSDGTTPAPISASSVDTSQIASGTSSVAVVAVGGNVRTNIAGATVQTISSTGVEITGNLSVTGNATLSGNILGDRVQNGTTSIDIQTPSGNANITVAGTSNVAVFSTAGANITGTLGVTGNITGGNISATAHTGTTVSVSGNITGGNLSAGTGTVTGGQFVNGTSNIVVAASGNIDMAIGGSPMITVTTTAAAESTSRGLIVEGFIWAKANGVGQSGNVIGGNIRTGGTVSATGNITGGNVLTGGLISATGNITGGNVSGTNLTGTLTTAAQTNITSVGALNGGSITSGFGAIDIGTDTVTCGGIINSNGNGIGNIGSSTTYFNTVFAKATSAQYADLAEKYVADAEYPAGTVVVFGGDKEVTVTSVDADRAVAGVISTNPSYIMNGGLEAEFVATVALTGRVPCRVTGKVNKGDLMVSAGYGLARAEQDPRVGTVIGKALEDHEGNEGVIEVVVGRF